MSLSAKTLGWASAITLLFCLAGRPADAGTAPGGEDFAPMVAKVLPSVVNITVDSWTFPGSKSGSDVSKVTDDQSYGSGFVIDPTGLILTNRHVIAGADRITVVLNDGTRLNAKVIATAADDLAVLRVEADHPLPAITWGDSTTLLPGEAVIAIGNPLGLGTTVTAGIVSALDRDIHLSPWDAFIQTDAAINRGNSGGPLFNLKGEVVGVNTALYSPGSGGSVGLGFAIPSFDARFVIDQLLTYGFVRIGWIGVQAQNVTQDIASGGGLKRAMGAILISLTAGGPAARAGLRLGDIITRVDNQVIGDPRYLNRAIGIRAGRTAMLSVWRQGVERLIPVAVAVDPRAHSLGRMAGNDRIPQLVRRADLGLVLAAAPGTQAKPAGVRVVNVVPRSVAALHGITPGETVLNVQGEPAHDAAQVLRVIAALRGQGRRYVLLLVTDGKQPRWIALPLRSDPDTPSSK